MTSCFLRRELEKGGYRSREELVRGKGVENDSRRFYSPKVECLLSGIILGCLLQDGKLGA